MAIKASNTTNGLTIDTFAYTNCDDVLLFWRVAANGHADAEVPNCRGFELERRRRQPDGSWGAIEIIRNRTGFAGQSIESTGDELSKAPTQPSSIWPFQCFDWTDHGASNGDTVGYRVSAVELTAGGDLGTSTLAAIANGDWTEAISVSANVGGGLSAFFNRGAVMSQYVARIARLNGWKAGDIKAHIKDLEEPLRRFLSGELRLAILKMLDDVIDDPSLEFYAALYELSDDELIERLKLLRTRAHVVLANGSDKTGDGNAASRTALEGADVDVHDRLLGNKGLGHNKFGVVVRRSGSVPLKAWTGSTNWAPTGLCTQLNNGLLMEDSAVAQLYLDQ